MALEPLSAPGSNETPKLSESSEPPLTTAPPSLPDLARAVLREGELGVLAWNARRALDPERPALDAVDLSGADLSKADLRGALLLGANLKAVAGDAALTCTARA